MTEDYPRYPDIHDLDLTLLSPRMIVVRLIYPTETENNQAENSDSLTGRPFCVPRMSPPT